MRRSTIAILSMVLLCAAGPASAKSFLRCGGWACSLTAVEVRGVETAEAWALGRTTRRDAEKDCEPRRDGGYRQCVAEQSARPPVVIEVNCIEGTAGFYGALEPFKLSAKAKAGQLAHAQDPAFWEGEMSHRARSTVISWFNLLCPKLSRKLNIKEE